MMNRSKVVRWTGAAFGFLLLVSLVSRVAAQEPNAPNRLETRRPVAEVVQRIGEGAGIVVLTDSTVQGLVPLPHMKATPETVEKQITDVVEALPAGTTWAKLYVPVPANGRWNGDTVVEYAQAQAKLVGKAVGGAIPAGNVEILGRLVPTEKAQEYITGLNLKLVYVLTNPGAKSANRTPEQRAQQAAQQIRNMDPLYRAQAVWDMLAEQSAFWQALSPEEAIQLKQELSRMKSAQSGNSNKVPPRTKN